MEKRALLVLILIGSIYWLVPVVQSECSGEIDMTGVVSWVEDGDTFRMDSGDWVRLADVDAPEDAEEGYYESKSFLFELVHNKTVYLDIDDINGTDKYGRLVCVAFVDQNSTHVVNVNKALLVNGHAVMWNFTNNEFDPYEWSLYCPFEAIPEFSSFLIPPMFIVATLLAVILHRRRHSM